jgi:hypothetical protein
MPIRFINPGCGALRCASKVVQRLTLGAGAA